MGQFIHIHLVSSKFTRVSFEASLLYKICINFPLHKMHLSTSKHIFLHSFELSHMPKFGYILKFKVARRLCLKFVKNNYYSKTKSSNRVLNNSFTNYFELLKLSNLDIIEINMLRKYLNS